MNKDQETIRNLRARIRHMRWHLDWIHNPAGNNILSPKEIAAMGLKRTRKEFVRKLRSDGEGT